MKKPIRVSHSALSTFNECGKKYEYKYIHKLPVLEYNSPLIFGSAIDTAIGELLLLKKVVLNPLEASIVDKINTIPNYLYQVFDTKFALQKPLEEQLDMDGNSQDGLIDIRHDYRCEYFASDFDESLLDDTDIRLLKKYMKTAGYSLTEPIELFNALSEEKKTVKLDLVNKEFYNYCCFLSLRHKGHILIDVMKNDVMPLIQEVRNIQTKISLKNDLGDELVGYQDLEVLFIDDPVWYVGDIKTSSSSYADSAVEDKDQLAIYDTYSELGHGAYIVLLKKPTETRLVMCDVPGHFSEIGSRKKKCPTCKSTLNVTKTYKYGHQIIKGQLKTEHKDKIYDTISDTLHKIKHKEFTKDLNSCFSYGRKCPYYDQCKLDN